MSGGIAVPGKPQLNVFVQSGPNASPVTIPIQTAGGLDMNVYGGLTKLEHAASLIASQVSNRIEVGEYATDEDKLKALDNASWLSVTLAQRVLGACDKVQAGK